MWSAPGHNPMGESQWTAHYQTMPTNQVDWAALAQQWIAMKGSSNFAPPPMQAQVQHQPPPPMPAPPPPPILSQSQSFQNEGGVANMDLEDDDEEVEHHSHHQQQQHHHQPPVFKSSSSQYQNKPYNHQPRKYNKWNQPSPTRPSMNSQQPPSSVGPPVGLDAAARKKLPPWIREGLEKMEKEKMKKEEAEKRAKLREEKLRKQRLDQLERSPQRSKFDDMTSDASDVEEQEEEAVINQNNVEEDSEEDEEEEVPVELTKEEILEEISAALRRSMTEILLEVTNEEINEVANEVIRAQGDKHAKHSAKK